MTVKLQRPILVGGVGLSYALWLWQSFHHSVAQAGEFSMFAALLIGAAFWLLQGKTSKKIDFSPKISTLEKATVEKAIAKAEIMIKQLETETVNQEIITQLQEKAVNLTTQLDRKELQLIVTGGKKVGKTNLMKVLQSNWLPKQTISLQETPALFTAINTESNEVPLSSDLVLFVTAGDLTHTEFQTLQQLKTANQRTILVFNKQDQYLPPERVTVLQQLRQHMEGILPTEDVVAIASSPTQVKVRQHQEDASVQEWMEEQKPDLTALTERLNQIIDQESQQLVWGSTIRLAEALFTEAKTELNKVRGERALPIIEQYQWIAAAAAFANPVPALDLLATAAISAQLVVELGEIYQQKFSLSQAQIAVKTISSLMVKLGLVELSTQTIGGILKSNAVTFVAGGAVQGISAAYLTRLAGLSLIEYFQEMEQSEINATGQFNLEQLGQKLQNVFQQNQRVAFLRGFIKQGVARILPESPKLELTASETTVTAI
jgi:uncharacterized protein (DUF697 family)